MRLPHTAPHTRVAECIGEGVELGVADQVRVGLGGVAREFRGFAVRFLDRNDGHHLALGVGRERIVVDTLRR